MDNKKLKEVFNNLLQNKKVFNLVCLSLVIAFILLTINIITSGNDKSLETFTNQEENVEQKTNNNEADKEITYEDAEKQKLIEILSKIKGVGKVDVSMYFATSEVRVPAEQSNTQVSTTEETDSNGGTRVNNSQTDSSTIVMQSESGQSNPVILQVNKPEITGIIVIAEGAGNEQIKYDIQTAVSKLYNLSVANVNVYEMESSQ